MSLIVLSSNDVSQVIQHLSPSFLVFMMASVLDLLSVNSSDMVAPHRTTVMATNHTTLWMPARIQGVGTAMKVASVPSSGANQRGLPASSLLIDEVTGVVKALVNARQLTAIRTAATSLLASCLLASPTPKVLVVFGAGAQIASHVDLHLRYFPSISRCTIINRTINARSRALQSKLCDRFPAVTTTLIPLDDRGKVETCVAEADIICTATSSTKPLFPTTALRAEGSVHINLVGSYTPGMRECDEELLKRAGIVVVDSREACAKEAGEIIASGIGTEDMMEIGELVNLRMDPEDKQKLGVAINANIIPVETKLAVAKSKSVTVFKTVGIGLQDVAITSAVVAKAEKLGIGVRIGDYDSF